MNTVVTAGMRGTGARYLLATGAALLTCLVGAVAAVAAFAPDPTFDADGKWTFDFSGGIDVARAVAVQPDGKIVVAGNGNPNNDFAMSRLSSNGTPDPSFDGDGHIGIDFGGVDVANDVALQPDGKIVVVGYTPGPGGQDFAAMRLNPNGSLDPTFDTDGKWTLDLSAGNDVATAVALQPDGKIVIVGRGYQTYDFTVVRLNSNGRPDTSFDVDGQLGVNLGEVDMINGVALQPDGKIVAVGTTSGAGGGDFAAARFNTNGSLDPTFDTDGKWTFDFSGGYDIAQAAAVQPDGKIVIAGRGNPNSDFAMTRLGADGTPDPSFDGDGHIGIGFGGGPASDLVLQPDGKIVVVGATGAGDFGVLRLNPNGSPDVTLGVGGKLTVDFGSDIESAEAVALQSDGAIVVVGDANSDFAVTRLTSPGTSPGTPPGTPPGTVVRCGGFAATIAGTAGADKIGGTPGNDVIAALGGNDTVDGRGGNDIVCGGAGNDVLEGAAGNDKLFGDAGKDLLKGGAGKRDVCQGGPAKDRATGCEKTRTL